MFIRWLSSCLMSLQVVVVLQKPSVPYSGMKERKWHWSFHSHMSWQSSKVVSPAEIGESLQNVCVEWEIMLSQRFGGGGVGGDGGGSGGGGSDGDGGIDGGHGG